MKFSPLPLAAALSLAGALLTGMLGCKETSAPAEPVPDRQPVPVSVAEVVHATITEWQQFTGRLEAPDTVELRPRVSGYINQVVFEEGSLVSKGDLLFQIDPRPFQLEVARLQAELKSALARQKLANSDLKRAQSLRQQKAIAIEQLEARQADLEQAQASVESVRAELETERLKLSFTEVTAPITGRVSSARVSAGNYVTAGQTALTSLVSVDEMHAWFNTDEQAFLRYHQQQELASNGGQQVLMKLTTDQDYPFTGKVDFIDNQVDPQTGTIRFRATFENSAKRLTPGLFVRLKVAGSRYATVLVDDQAIATDLSNKYVLVLMPDNTLEYRKVIAGDKHEGLRIIHDGLKKGETIVTKGLQRVFPGSKVAPEDEIMGET